MTATYTITIAGFRHPFYVVAPDAARAVVLAREGKITDDDRIREGDRQHVLTVDEVPAAGVLTRARQHRAPMLAALLRTEMARYSPPWPPRLLDALDRADQGSVRGLRIAIDTFLREIDVDALDGGDMAFRLSGLFERSLRGRLVLNIEVADRLLSGDATRPPGRAGSGGCQDDLTREETPMEQTLTKNERAARICDDVDRLLAASLAGEDVGLGELRETLRCLSEATARIRWHQERADEEGATVERAMDSVAAARVLAARV